MPSDLNASGALDRDRDAVVDGVDNCPDVPNPGQSDRDHDGVGDACDVSDASPGPTLGETVVGRLRSGQVFVRRPSGSRTRARSAQAPGAPAGFVPLQGAGLLPVGTIVDASRGRLSITAHAGLNARGRRTTQSSDFRAGVFAIRQRRARRPVTDIELRSTGFTRLCGRAATAADDRARAAQRRSGRVVNRVFGDGRGRFRTRGRYSAATVRGTIWLTADRCDGTLTRVTRGSVSVRDLTARRTVIVRAGRSYLARAARAAARTRRR